MTKTQIIRRRIKLKRQAVRIIRQEIQQLKLELSLLQVRHFLEGQIGITDDRHGLSKCIDMADTLIQTIREC